MSIITLDIETFYDKDYDLRKLTTEEYIRDARFEVIGVGIKIDQRTPVWITGNNILQELKALNLKQHAVLCHNAMFDASILAWHYHIVPGMYFDTMLMARAKLGPTQSVSLGALASRYGLGVKGDEAIQNMGKRLADFSRDDLRRYGDYCCNDTNLTSSLFSAISPFPDDELRLIDLTIRMHTEPTLQVNKELLQDRLVEIQQEKSAMFKSLMAELKCPDEECVRAKLASNIQFAVCLEDAGVDPPMKISPSTGKETYALAKTDEGFIELQDSDNPVVQQLCAVRLGTKSTMEESRIERFISISDRNHGFLPVPLKYYGAHTGRWSGSDGVNFQNLPSRDKTKKTLKNALIPDKDHVIINGDSSQIEARILAWWAGQEDLVTAFREGRDVYSEFASEVYHEPVTRADVSKRFVGKESILSLGFGVGAEKLRRSLKTKGNVDMELSECKAIVNLYRSENKKVVELWEECGRGLSSMIEAADMVKRIRMNLGRPNANVFVSDNIILPNDLNIFYPDLRWENNELVYNSRYGSTSIWGGSLVENIVQALARIIIGQQMVWLADEGLRPVLTVHDSLVYVVHKSKCEWAVQLIKDYLSSAPAWAVGLPLTAEVKWGESYGVC